ncbi:hypothetical protein N7462_007144, partial [Penicillium macrosclerotiorum]|uniref:uncharacterized protein n=1 Tax=Penicillium macrosclerotiorum TaxID=303699 RepID=UPI00254882EF
CQRLKKECRPSPTVRKRNARSTASRTAQLEAKLDSLVSLLQTTGNQSSLPADWDSTSSEARQAALSNLAGASTTSGNILNESHFSNITEIIQQKLFIEVEPSLDLLLGLMTFISWTTYSRKPFLNFYGHVVMGLVCELGIDKAPPKDLTTMQAYKCAVGLRPNISTARSMEERRAALGCFVLTSSIAINMFKIDALRWNSHLEESLAILMEAKESPEDERLVVIVKIHLVIDKIYHLQRDAGNHTPPLFYTKAFQSQLESVKNDIPEYLRQDKYINFYLCDAESMIHEPALRDSSSPNSPELHRLESLYASLHSAKSWLDLWLTVPVERYMAIPFPAFFQFSRAVVNLFRLSILDDPAWDRILVRNTANILEYLDRMAFHIKGCLEIHTHSPRPQWSIFEKGAKMVQTLKQNWEPKLMEIWYPSLPTNEIGSGYDNANQTIPAILPVNTFDDAWMMEIFGTT